eukprot:TRINITY_DN7415_c0_g1_i1.p1 TRINITY_DN7415_c0_g1~~TRINITY_DN7415_c0_g1_i1.p1  ORF type:complete len:369 (+),score=65.39 TRINITY_DN7415_c0_g1_i1:43-1149(+)
MCIRDRGDALRSPSPSKSIGTDRGNQLKTASRHELQDPRRWTEGQVIGWFEDMRLPQYVGQLQANQVDGALLVALEDPELVEMGVTSGLHRKRILVKLQTLMEGPAEGQARTNDQQQDRARAEQQQRRIDAEEREEAKAREREREQAQLKEQERKSRELQARQKKLEAENRAEAEAMQERVHREKVAAQDRARAEQQQRRIDAEEKDQAELDALLLEAQAHNPNSRRKWAPWFRRVRAHLERHGSDPFTWDPWSTSRFWKLYRRGNRFNWVKLIGEVNGCLELPRWLLKRLRASVSDRVLRLGRNTETPLFRLYNGMPVIPKPCVKSERVQESVCRADGSDPPVPIIYSSSERWPPIGGHDSDGGKFK